MHKINSHLDLTAVFLCNVVIKRKLTIFASKLCVTETSEYFKYLPKLLHFINKSLRYRTHLIQLYEHCLTRFSELGTHLRSRHLMRSAPFFT